MKLYINGFFKCSNGFYSIREDAGLGVEPSDEGMKMLKIMNICK